MSNGDFNGRLGAKWTTIVPIAGLIIAGGATWGETRLTTATNVADIKELKEQHSDDVILLREGQDKITGTVNDLRTNQRVIQNDIDHIKESQERQEDMTKQILRALQRDQLPK